MPTKFIIFGIPKLANGFYDIAYKGIDEIPNARYISCIKPIGCSNFIDSFHKVLYSAKINSFFNVPFKKSLFHTFVPKDINKEDKVCFLFFSRWFADKIYVDFAKWLKQTYKDAKFVCYYQDTIASHANVDNAWVKDFFDIVLSYDEKDANDYRLTYFPTPYTKVDIPDDDAYKSDVYYLGTAKTRLTKILEYYDFFKSSGLDAKFLIAGNVSDEIKLKYPDIHFINGITYRENLKYVRNTKCLIEVIQDGATGITPRTWEAIAYNKILLTNNEYLTNTRFWNADTMTSYANDVVNMINETNNIQNEEIADSLHPKNLISFIENKLTNL